jgi:hypothetical protein
MLAGALAAFVGLALSAGAPAAAQGAKPVELQFANHLQMKLPEQDVFIVPFTSTDGKLVRIEADAVKLPANLATMVYASAAPVEHDPFKLGTSPLGPFARGAPLGISLEQWLAGTAKGTYAVNGKDAEINFTAQKLVPNGVYTVWCSRLTFPPNVKIVDAPCGKADGSQNVFKADAKGNGRFRLKLSALPDSNAETATVIALAYHSDGKTYGASPGKFGLNSHVQLAAMLPAPK